MDSSPLDASLAQLPANAGLVGLLSGDEFTAAVAEFDRAIIEHAGSRIGLVLCADHAHASMSAEHAREHFAALGAEVVVVDLAHDARDRIEDADVIYVAGGSPAELLACLRDPAIWDPLRARWEAGAALVGSSAGAMALCEHCQVPRPGDPVPTAWTAGVGVVGGIGVAAHASSRPVAWLERSAGDAPAPVLAIDDRTGVLMRPGDGYRVIGEGRAWFVASH